MSNTYIFSENDVRNILVNSEGTALPGRWGAGHTGAQHVSITNERMAQRMDDARRNPHTNGGIIAITSFLSLADAVRIGTIVLNSKEAEPVLATLYGSTPGTKKAVDVQLLQPVRARYALGDATSTCLCWFATMVIYRTHGLPPRGLHIRSFFPSFGRP